MGLMLDISDFKGSALLSNKTRTVYERKILKTTLNKQNKSIKHKSGK
jgi:hypothetical protein